MDSRTSLPKHVHHRLEFDRLLGDLPPLPGTRPATIAASDADSAPCAGGTLRLRQCVAWPRARRADLAPRLHLHIAKEQEMLWTICVILLVLWALGMATTYTAGGLIHLLLVIAVVVMVIRLFQGRRVV